MNKDDSVFFFTLVDFFVTALFFGLVLFAVGANRNARASIDAARMKAAADSVSKLTGVSNFAELTDRLSRLGPVKDAEKAVQMVKAAGGASLSQRALSTVVDAGGPDSVEARLARLRLHEGVGRRHCLVTAADPREALSLGTVTGTDSTISFSEETPQLRDVLALLGLSFEEVRVMTLRDFRAAFASIVTRRPDCLYTLTFIERTRFVEARDAARGLFYMRIRK
jgi:hypothetical protein